MTSEQGEDEKPRRAQDGKDAAVEAAYRVELPQFEGPLDLLLHLIQKHELDILDIPIRFIAQKYNEYIRSMEALSIDLASEYLVMAATLVHIKSRMLLPPDPSQVDDDELAQEEEDPRAELIRRLLEYQKYKQAAADLGHRSVLGRDVFGRGISIESQDGLAPLAPLSLFRLMDAFESVLQRVKQVQHHVVDFERVSIADKISQISDRLRSKRRLQFEELFIQDESRAEMIVTFLALLEMTKLRLTRLFQEGPLEPIFVELAVSEDELPAAGLSEQLSLEVTPRIVGAVDDVFAPQGAESDDVGDSDAADDTDDADEFDDAEEDPLSEEGSSDEEAASVEAPFDDEDAQRAEISVDEADSHDDEVFRNSDEFDGVTDGASTQTALGDEVLQDEDALQDEDVSEGEEHSEWEEDSDDDAERDAAYGSANETAPSKDPDVLDETKKETAGEAPESVGQLDDSKEAHDERENAAHDERENTDELNGEADEV